MANSALQQLEIDPGNDRTRLFNRQYDEEVGYNPSEVDGVISFFLKRGFEEISAINTAVVLLRQAKLDKIPVFQLIDTLKGLNDVQLSNIVAQILNLNRTKTSTLGYRISAVTELFDQRNVLL